MYTLVNHPIRVCKWEKCLKEFKPNSRHQNFCNKNCYKSYGRKYLGHKNTKVWIKGKLSGYRKHKKDVCESCGFRGHSCQLDVDHIDGNHNNHDPTNLQTLCANCHRLKTYQQLWS